MTPASGLLVVDKPAGPTSFQCVARIRRILGEKLRVGHCGTLDPMAQGVLLVLFGRAATRQQESFLGLEKQYWFRARWGIATETGDREGKEIGRFPTDRVTADALAQTAAGFVGEYRQTPPAYAALKFKGRHYYDWARQGVEIPRAARPVTIYAFDVLAHDAEHWEGRIRCSRGTYVRTLAEDVAKRLSSGAHLVDLIRERVGPYCREDALKWPEIETMSRDALLTHVQNPLHHHAGIV